MVAIIPTWENDQLGKYFRKAWSVWPTFPLAFPPRIVLPLRSPEKTFFLLGPPDEGPR